MKVKLKKTPRTFSVGKHGEILIKDWGKIYISDDEMISFVNPEGKEYDIVAKDWGFYATPSINGRLLDEGFKTALVKNSFNKFYIMLVDPNKMEDFDKYLETDNQKLVEWLDERIDK